MSRDGTGLPKALYLHVPFCKKRCSYCDFESRALSEADVDPSHYARALVEKLATLSDAGFLRDCETAYIGGGTPTVLGEALPRLVESVVGLAGPLAELTFEANPESATPRLLEMARDAGVTRVSIGVQSLDDAVLARIGRLHTAAEALEALRVADGLGYRVSADLMAGLPGARAGALARHAQTLVEYGASHVSLYPLEVHGQTPLGRAVSRGSVEVPGEDEVAEELEGAASALEAGGLHRYEIASFARAGQESLHNRHYWDGAPYLGLGQGASSMLSRGAYARLREVVPTLPEAPREVARLRLTCTSTPRRIARTPLRSLSGFTVEGLTEASALAEDLMLAVRCTTGISRELDARARRTFGVAYQGACARLVELGLLEEARDGAWAYRPSRSAWLLSNELFGAFWALAPDEPVQLA